MSTAINASRLALRYQRADVRKRPAGTAWSTPTATRALSHNHRGANGSWKISARAIKAAIPAAGPMSRQAAAAAMSTRKTSSNRQLSSQTPSA